MGRSGVNLSSGGCGGVALEERGTSPSATRGDARGSTSHRHAGGQRARGGRTRQDRVARATRRPRGPRPGSQRACGIGAAPRGARVRCAASGTGGVLPRRDGRRVRRDLFRSALDHPAGSFQGGSVTRPRILVTLTDRTEPADNGKRLRAAANLRALARVGDLDVVLLHFDQPLDVRPVPPDVPTDHWSVVRKQRHSLPEAAFRMLRLLPLQIAAVDWMPLRAEIIKLTQRHWDLVWFGSLDHFAVLRDLIGDVPVVVDYDDVEPAKTDAFLEVAPRDPAGRGMRVKARVERVFWRRLERLAQERAAAVVVCSDLDVRRLGGRRAVAVPNTYPDPGEAVPLEAPADPEFLLIANFGYKPNIDAARFVTQDVLPVIRRALPNA